MTYPSFNVTYRLEIFTPKTFRWIFNFNRVNLTHCETHGACTVPDPAGMLGMQSEKPCSFKPRETGVKI